MSRSATRTPSFASTKKQHAFNFRSINQPVTCHSRSLLICVLVCLLLLLLYALTDHGERRACDNGRLHHCRPQGTRQKTSFACFLDGPWCASYDDALTRGSSSLTDRVVSFYLSFVLPLLVPLCVVLTRASHLRMPIDECICLPDLHGSDPAGAVAAVRAGVHPVQRLRVAGAGGPQEAEEGVRARGARRVSRRQEKNAELSPRCTGSNLVLDRF
jgi:hypothetical protein